MTQKIYFALALIFLCCVPVSAKYSGGTGEPNDPYLIATPNDLNSIGLDANDWDKHFLMTADINLAEITGAQFNIIGVDWNNRFTGVFDGNGHTISNFTYVSTGTDCIGIFGSVYGSSALISNVRLIDPNIQAGTGWHVGGLVGVLRYGTVTDCHVRGGDIDGHFYVGGLVGTNREGVVQNCSSDASVSADDQAGGLIGIMSPSGTISNCHASGDVSAGGVDDEVSAVGGLVAYVHATVSNCYATGNVSGIDRPAGGLIGTMSGGAALNCYASGYVSDTSGNDGGLIGRDFGFASYTKCFWDSDINSDVNGIGNISNDPNVIGLPTIEMQMRSTFKSANWDMINIWNIGENQTYPFLRTHLPSDINKDDETNFLDLAILADNWLKEQ